MLGDLMVEYIKRPGRLSCLDEFKRHQFPMVKIQCVGPATLMMDNWSDDRAVESIYRHVSTILDGLDGNDLAKPDFVYLIQAYFDIYKSLNLLYHFQSPSGI